MGGVADCRQTEMHDARVAIVQSGIDGQVALVGQHQLQANGLGSHAGVGAASTAAEKVCGTFRRSRQQREHVPLHVPTLVVQARDDERRDVHRRPAEQIEQASSHDPARRRTERFEQRLVAFERETRQQVIEARGIERDRWRAGL